MTPTTTEKQIGHLLKRARMQTGRTCAAIAGEVGISRHHLSYIENGIRRASPDMLCRIARVLRIDPKPLLCHFAEAPPSEKRMEEIFDLLSREQVA